MEIDGGGGGSDVAATQPSSDVGETSNVGAGGDTAAVGGGDQEAAPASATPATIEANSGEAPAAPTTPAAPASTSTEQTPTAATERNRDAFEPTTAQQLAADAARLNGGAAPTTPRRDNNNGVGAPLDKLLKTDGKVNVRQDGDDYVLSGNGSVGTKDLGTKPGSRIGIDANAKVTGNFEVRVPKDAATEAIRNGQIPNPADPNSWPTGTRVSGDVKFQANGDLSIGRNPVTRLLGFNTGADFADTRGFTMNKLDDSTVRVTASSRQNLDDNLGIRGLSGDQSQNVGNTRTADFDLRTQEGMNAYQNFLRTGNLPTDNGTGVRNVGQTLDKSVDKGTSFLGLPLNRNREDTTATIGPNSMRVLNNQDSSVLGTMKTDHVAGESGSHTRTTINDFIEHNRYNLGTEPGPRGDYTMKITDPQAAQLFRTAFTGNPSDDKSPLTLRMTEAQARDMVNRMSGPSFQPAPDRLNYALRGMTAGGQQPFAYNVYNAYFGNNTRRPFAGTLE